MCGPGQQPGAAGGAPAACQSSAPLSARDAVAMVLAGLSWLAGADMTGVPAVVQADCLRGLERARSVQAAAHAAVLGAFDAGCGYEDDGSRSPRTWLMWQTRATPATATASAGWARRLRGHPAIASALPGGEISASRAKVILDRADHAPAGARDQA